ncbi:MAG: DUF2249 domain-containing protein [Bacteroidetes bacterium]|nr:DUF2249 domain-containing protein [Bacteroidota bacterium]
MKINSGTKISVIIAHNKEAIEAIASVNPHFNKLRNPILRRILAPRVSVADAARIGKCKPEDLLEKLQAIGFEIETTKSVIPASNKDDSTQPVMQIQQALSKNQLISFDVRPVIQSGNDPFQTIQHKLNELPDGYALELINSFEPVPLITIFEKKGFSTWVKKDTDKVTTYFMNVSGTTQTIDSKIPDHAVTAEKLDEVYKSFNGKLKETDVRDLEMPLPMLTILGELEELPEGFALYVHHKKVPQYLIPELAERKFRYIWNVRGENDVKLLIFR